MRFARRKQVNKWLLSFKSRNPLKDGFWKNKSNCVTAKRLVDPFHAWVHVNHHHQHVFLLQFMVWVVTSIQIRST
jgi:hypothetical protein